MTGLDITDAKLDKNRATPVVEFPTDKISKISNKLENVLGDIEGGKSPSFSFADIKNKLETEGPFELYVNNMGVLNRGKIINVYDENKESFGISVNGRLHTNTATELSSINVDTNQPWLRYKIGQNVGFPRSNGGISIGAISTFYTDGDVGVKWTENGKPYFKKVSAEVIGA